MAEIIEFPRPSRPEPYRPGMTEEEVTRYLGMLARGYSEQTAIEILALARRSKGEDHADHPAAS